MASDIDLVVGQIIDDFDLKEWVRPANLSESELEIIENDIGKMPC